MSFERNIGTGVIMKCKVEDCSRKIWARGYCNTHLGHMYRYGEIRRTKYTPNEIIVSGDTAEILLYNADCKEVARAIIDADDVERVSGIKWGLHGTGYVQSKHNGSLHNLILGQKYVDHINRKPLDCRKSNLRPATHAQNCRNRTLRSDNSTGVRGVTFVKKSNRYMARIQRDGQSKYLGDFKTLEEAATVRHQAAMDIHGQFAAERQDGN